MARHTLATGSSGAVRRLARLMPLAVICAVLNATTVDSVTALRQALNDLANRPDRDTAMEIVLAPGTYRLTEPLVIDASISGTPDAPVVIRAEAKGSATLSGSARVTGWTPWRDGIWRADVPESKSFDELYWRGRRQVLARTPNRTPEHPRTGGMLYVAAPAPDKAERKESFIYDPRFLAPSPWGDARGFRYNYVHDTGGYNMVSPGRWEFPHYCWAIYLDDMTSGVTVFGNVLKGAYRGGLHIHGGQDNVVENNIFDHGTTEQFSMNGFGGRVVNGRAWEMKGNRIRRNVFTYSGASTAWLRGNSDLPGGIAECNANAIWPGDADVYVEQPRQAPVSFAGWQEKGFDTHNIVADPLFADAADGDYRIRPGSPALARGFQQIPMHEIGLQDTPERLSWPVSTEAEREVPVAANELPPEPLGTVRVQIPRLSMEPVIDGILDRAERTGECELILTEDHHGDRASATSRARARWDDDRLYLGIHNAGDEGKPIVPGTTWGRVDAIEVAIRDGQAADGTPILVLRGYTDGTLVVDTSGGMLEEDCANARDAVRYAADVQTDRKWTAELSIPWPVIPGLGDRPRNTPLQFNLTCRKPAASVWLMWHTTGRYSFGVGPEGLLVPLDRGPRR